MGVGGHGTPLPSQQSFADHAQAMWARWTSPPRPTASTGGFQPRAPASPSPFAVGQPLPRVKPLTSDQIKILKLPLVPYKIVNWEPLFWGIAMERNAEFYGYIEQLMHHTEDTIVAACHADPYLKAANQWVASNVFVCLDDSCDEVKAFRVTVAKRTGMLFDGVSLIARIREYAQPKADATERAAQELFRKAVYFHAGMSIAAAKLSATNLCTTFERLTLFTGEVSLRLALLHKIPNVGELATEKKTLEQELLRDEAAKRPQRYTRDELIDMISAAVARTKGSPNTQSSEGNAGSADGEQEPLVKCPNCGSKHSRNAQRPWLGCTRKCEGCGGRTCPKRGCVVATSKKLPPRAEIKDALGKPVTESVYKDMERRHKLFLEKGDRKGGGARGGKAAREAAAAEEAEEDEDECESMESYEGFVADDARFPGELQQPRVTFYSGSIELLECDEQMPDVQDAAAVVLQSRWRGFLVRSQLSSDGSTSEEDEDGVSDAVESSEELPPPDESPPPSPPPSPPSHRRLTSTRERKVRKKLRNSNAIKLQAAARGFTARQRAKQLTLELWANAYLQSVVRGWLARKMLKMERAAVCPLHRATASARTCESPKSREPRNTVGDPSGNSTLVPPPQPELGRILARARACAGTAGALVTAAYALPRRVLVVLVCIAAVLAVGGMMAAFGRGSQAAVDVCSIDGGLLAATLEHGPTVASSERSESSDELADVWIQLDGGSNVNFINVAAAKAAFGTRRKKCSIKGIGAAADVEIAELISVGVVLDEQGLFRFELVDACFATGSRRTLISESYLADQYGVDVLKNAMVMRWPDGREWPLIRRNGLYFVRGSLVALEPTGQQPEAVVAVKADDTALLWASRMNVDSTGLSKFANAVHGVSLPKVSKQTQELIDKLKFHRFEVSRAHPVGSTPTNARAERPGHTFICDGFGKHEAVSPVDGATYQFHAVCEYTSYGYTATSSAHTVAEWMDFLSGVVADAAAHGHTCVCMRFDRAPELASGELKRRLKDEHNVHAQLTPRRHHEGVGGAEVNNDILTRMAEADLQRCQRGTAYLLPARAYAQYRLNKKAVGTNKESREQRYKGKVPVLDPERPLYLFGTAVLFNEEKAARGPKGSLDKPRASEGIMLGIASDGHAYLVQKRSGGIVQPRHVDPLDELQLMRRGIPASGALVDADTQTPPPEEELTPPVAPKRTPAARPPRADLKVDDRVAVEWLPPQGALPVEYVGKVVALEAKGERRMWQVRYDGWDGLFQHDFDRTTRKWRKLPTNATPSPPPAAAPTVRATRSRTRDATASAFVEAGLEACTSAEMLNVFNTAVYQALGDAGDGYMCSSLEQLETCRVVLAQAEAQSIAHIEPECNKATQNNVKVKTALGEAIYHVPCNRKELFDSPFKEQWLAADRKALDVILRAGNRLVPEEGKDVARCVTTRKIKLEQATGELDKHDPFKSRHALDGGHQEMLRARVGNARDVNSPSSNATIVDDLTMNLFLSTCALHKAKLCKGDVGNAYAKGRKLGRGVSYMALPSTLPLKDESGRKLCIELTTPLWGEPEAGHEWECAFNAAIIKAGWVPCEGVPAMFRYEDATGTAYMITIVDDFLIQDRGDGSITKRTIDAIKGAFNGEVKVEHEPQSFAGRKITRDIAKGILTVSMPIKLEEAALAHVPELLEGKKLGLPTGKKLTDLADQMALVPREGNSKLTKEQSETQQIIGRLKFIEKVTPKLSLIVHRLSCVMSSPPPEALIVAKAALVSAYGERHVGITYGGDGPDDDARLSGRLTANVDLNEPAGKSLEASADATTGDRNLYAMLLTHNHGDVLHMTKKLQLLVASTQEAEAIGTCKAAEEVSYARVVLRALDDMPQKPTIILTDNLANMLVAADARSAARSKHFLTRYITLQQRIASDEVIVVKVDDANMPSDFLTKWLPSPKLRRSVAYATNSRARVPHE